MNRNRRHASERSRRFDFDRPDPQPSFSEVPTATLCESIMLLVKELRSRGFPLKDFDDRTRTLQQIQIYGDSICFLAAPELPDVKEGENEAQTAQDC
jgi:hypothetical protein